ncbi:MAG: NAD(P)-dependent oxidoreductase [Beutenbergiaceae bacterium]
MDNTQRLTVIGASRGTGALFAQRAARTGHLVRAVARSAPAYQHPRISWYRADATDSAALTEPISGADAVIIMVGAPGRDRSQVRAMTTRAVVAAMNRAGVRRLLVQSSLGIGDSHTRLNLITRYLVFPLLLAPAMADHRAQEAIVMDSGMDWTLLRPGYLSDGEPSGQVIAVDSSYTGPMRDRLTRADVVDAALSTLVDPQTIGQALMVGLHANAPATTR